MHILLNFFLSGIFLFGGNDPVKNNNCSELSNNLGSQFQAMEKIRQTDFNFEQSFRTLNVIGVQKGTYYSCGVGDGYMIIETSRGSELYENVPRELWESFISSRNIDYYYQRVIKNNGRYFY